MTDRCTSPLGYACMLCYAFIWLFVCVLCLCCLCLVLFSLCACVWLFPCCGCLFILCVHAYMYMQSGNAGVLELLLTAVCEAKIDAFKTTTKGLLLLLCLLFFSVFIYVFVFIVFVFVFASAFRYVCSSYSYFYSCVLCIVYVCSERSKQRRRSYTARTLHTRLRQCTRLQ